MAATFEVGATYECRWPGDHTMTTPCTVVARTAKFVTVHRFGDPADVTHRVGVNTWDGREVALPWGKYSMCPVLGANRRVA